MRAEVEHFNPVNVAPAVRVAAARPHAEAAIRKSRESVIQSSV